MATGQFLLRFFEERGEVHIKPNGEADVLCPFPHNKGYETRPSAHINVEKGVFHCKTCESEGRFDGLSEPKFISLVHNIPYSQAIKMMQLFEKHDETHDDWQQAHQNLLGQPKSLEWLMNVRGLTIETIQEYELGWLGAGTVVYPVFVNDVLLDRRTYFADREPGQPKIKSDTGASALLFPFDHWKKSDGVTVIMAGENDTLLARQMGFNAVTSTFGEGNFPVMFVGFFKGKDVYICYDCDEAGKKSALRVAFILTEAGANVYLVDLGLPGTKDDKDFTDFVLKHGKTAADFQALLDAAKQYDGEMYIEQKNKEYPLVNLWDIQKPEYSGKRISSRVMVMGRVDTPYGENMEIPTAVEWNCHSPVEGSKICEMCRLNGKQGWWTLEEDNLGQLLKMVEVDEKKLDQAIRQFIKIPAKCPGGVRVVKREKQFVQRIIFAPDADTEDALLGYRAVEQHGYVIGQALEQGGRYRIFFRRYPHPKNSALVAVVDKVEESDSAINKFQLTPEVIQQLSQFQGEPEEVMKKRYETAVSVVAPGVPRAVVETVNIMYHSVLDFKYAGRSMKGHPEALIVGESRTFKSETAKKLMQFYGIGNHTEVKAASLAGLLGGADKTNSGGHRIRWGVIPRNHKGLIFLDEMSGIETHVLAGLTAVRSERVANINKIVNGSAPAKTRICWISNPRAGADGTSRPIYLYPNGVEIIRHLVGSDEDIARLDFVVVLPPNETYVPPFTEEELKKLDSTAYRNLIYWAWSRREDQIKFADGVERYIWQVAQELNERFDCDVKLFGAEAHKKLARISVAVAAMCFSHDGTGDSIVVQKSHVDWSRDFMCRCYDNDVFRLADYVEERRMTMTINEEICNVFAHLVQSHGLLMKTLSRHAEVSMQQLKIISGLEPKEFSEVISNLVVNGLIETSGQNIMPTMRFKKAQQWYRNNVGSIKLTPVSQEGGFFG